MKFAIKNPNPGVTFYFVDSDPDSGGVSIRSLNPKQLRVMQKETTKTVDIFKHGQRFEKTVHDEDKFARLLWDYVIESWWNLEDEDGKEIECNADNKYTLMMENIGFAKFIGQCREKLEADAAEREEQVEKN